MKKVIKFILIASIIFSFAPQSANAITFTQVDQDVTAYTASQKRSNGTARTNAAGLVPKAGDVAMKFATSIPFGSTVTTPVVITNGDGQSLRGFTVNDNGVDPDLSKYAIDVWWGFCRTDNYSGTNSTLLGCSTSDAKYVSAIKFGRKTMDLNFYLRDN